MEQRFEVKPFGVKYVCDTCNLGEMKQTGKILLSDPPKFAHKCDQCGQSIDLLEKFPMIRYEVVQKEHS